MGRLAGWLAYSWLQLAWRAPSTHPLLRRSSWHLAPAGHMRSCCMGHSVAHRR